MKLTYSKDIIYLKTIQNYNNLKTEIDQQNCSILTINHDILVIRYPSLGLRKAVTRTYLQGAKREPKEAKQIL